MNFLYLDIGFFILIVIFAHLVMPWQVIWWILGTMGASIFLYGFISPAEIWILPWVIATGLTILAGELY